MQLTWAPGLRRFLAVLSLLTLVVLIGGCADPSSIEVRASISEGRAPLDVTFDATTENVDEIRWDFGDGTTLTTNPTDGPVDHTFTRSGSRQVRVAGVKIDGSDQQAESVNLVVTVFPGPLDSLEIEPESPTVKAGGEIEFSVVVLDEFGNRVRNAELEFQALTQAGNVDSDGIFTAGTTAGRYEGAVTVHVSQGGVEKTISTDVSIGPAELDSIEIEARPITATAGQVFEISPMAVDRFGNPIEDVEFEYSLTNNAGDSSGPEALRAATRSGDYQGALNVTASSDGVTVTSSFDLVIVPGPPHRAEFSPSDPTIEPNGQIDFEVTVFDEFDNLIEGPSVGFSSEGSVGTIDRSGAFVATDREGDFPDSVSAEISAGGATLMVSTDISIREPFHLSRVELVPDVTEVNIGGQVRVQVNAFDESDNPLEDANVVFGSDSEAGDINQNGVFVAGTRAGLYEAAVTAVVTRRDIALESSLALTIRPDPIDRVVLDPAAVRVVAGEHLQLEATGFDRHGNQISDVGIEYSVEPTAGRIDESGVFQAVEKAGTYPGAIQVKLSDGTTSKTAAYDAVVEPDVFASAALTPATSTVSVGQTVTFTPAGLDRFGNEVPNLDFGFEVAAGIGEVGSDGLFTAGTEAGVFARGVEVTVSDGQTSHTASATVQILPGPLHRVEVTPAAVEATPAQTVELTAVALDEHGNRITNAEISWTSGDAGQISDAGSLRVVSLADSYPEGVTAVASLDGEQKSVVVPVTVNPGPLASIEVDRNLSVAAGERFDIGAVPVDSFGNPVADASKVSLKVLDASVGSIDSSGRLVVGTTAGSFIDALEATASAGEESVSVRLSISIGPNALDSVSISPESTEVLARGEQSLRVIAKDRFGNVIDSPDVEWSTAGGGSITSGGVFTAGGTPGVFDDAIRATVTKDGVTRSASSQVAVREVFVVNSTVDIDDGSCDATHCSLRESIRLANADTEMNGIRFAIDSGRQSITVRSPMPAITGPLTIDGTSQPGFDGTPLVELNGALAGLNADALTIDASSVTVDSLVINRFQGSAILISGGGNNLVVGSFIGIDATGTAALVNGRGITISGSSNNTIGGTVAGRRNVISGNTVGIVISDGASGNTVIGNYIGTNATGTSDLGNVSFGILIDGGSDNIVGGDSFSERNLISGNDESGVRISGAGARRNRVVGNYIGTDVTGAKALGNTQSGVSIARGAVSNSIGGISSSNIISGNGGSGVEITGSGTNENLVQGNLIGTDLTGTKAMPNQKSGIRIADSADRTIVGGSAPGSGNLVSGNTGVGIEILTNSTRVTVLGNSIGTNLSGDAALANSVGVSIDNGSQVTIGDTGVAGRNVISGNTGPGVRITGTNAARNQIVGNFIGIEATGRTALKNSVGVLVSGAPETTIGTANVISGNTGHGIEVTGIGARDAVIEGNLIGTDVTGKKSIPNGGSGISVFASPNVRIGGEDEVDRNLISGNSQDGIQITGTTTAFTTNASVLGNYIGTDVTGTTTIANSGNGILVASAAGNTIGGEFGPGGNLISGNGGSGIKITASQSSANTVLGNIVGTDLSGARDLGNKKAGVLIEGAPRNTIGDTRTRFRNLISGNDEHGVRITGTDSSRNTVRGSYIGTDGEGLRSLPNTGSGIVIIDAPNTQIIGSSLAPSVISGNTQNGISISGSGSSGSRITGNLIGTNLAGDSKIGNQGSGIVVDGTPSVTIGGTTESSRNVISGNSGTGVTVKGASAKGVQISGNYIGTDSSGTSTISNGSDGVLVDGSPETVIGGTDQGSRNLISGNDGVGVHIKGTISAGSSVVGNYIGTDVTGSQRLGNKSAGVSIESSSNNLIGGTTVLSSNLISANGSGVRISGTQSTNNVVENNLIGTDVSGAIELGNLGTGILVDGSPNNRIGATSTDWRNIVSGNAGDGVVVQSSGATGNLIVGNYVGLDVEGRAALGNLGSGVVIKDASSNTVGSSTSTKMRNIIGGNGGHGVAISGSSAKSNLIRGNYIGTDVDGLKSVANASSGVFILNSSENRIGGDQESRNLISGNGIQGIQISGSSASGNLIQNNLIGTNVAGNASLGNASSGIAILNAPSNTIGGDITRGANVVSGNVGNGIWISGASAKTNTVHGNYIGTDVSGEISLPNGGDGVEIDGDASGNSIGNTTKGLGNVVAFNRGNGVSVHSGTTNSVRRNTFYSNGGLSVDLGEEGATPNDESDADSGANKLQNSPDFTAASINSQGSLVITYRVDTDTANAGYPLSIELYVSEDLQDVEGRRFLGRIIYSTNAETSVEIGRASELGISAGDLILATATDSEGNTSEFSQHVSVSVR